MHHYLIHHSSEYSEKKMVPIVLAGVSIFLYEILQNSYGSYLDSLAKHAPIGISWIFGASFLVIYFALYWIYEKWFWKILRKTPNIAGRWQVKLEPLEPLAETHETTLSMLYIV